MLDAGADPLAVATADGQPAVNGVAQDDLIPMVIQAAPRRTVGGSASSSSGHSLSRQRAPMARACF
jgi:hypothetical protein